MNSLPLPVRLAAAAVASAGLLWLAWWSAAAGTSRALSDASVRLRNPALAAQAAALAPHDPEAPYAQAGLAADVADLSIAEAAYRRTIELRPRDHVIWLELGKLQDQRGDAEAALVSFRAAARLAPSYAQPRWQTGNALLRSGRFDEAAAELRRAASADPTLYPNLLQALWHASGRDAGRLVDAARPEGSAERILLARFLARSGTGGEAVRVVREAGPSLTDEARRQVVDDLMAAGSYPEAHALWAEGRGGAQAGALTDGGFEMTARLDSSGFDWRFARDGGVRLSLDQDRPRAGARSLRVEFAGGSNPGQPLLSQIALVEPGGRYRLSFSERADGMKTGGPPVVGVVGLKAGGETTLCESAPLGSAEWRDHAMEFAVPRDVRAVRVLLRRQGCPGSPCPAFGLLWLDELRLTRL